MAAAVKKRVISNRTIWQHLFLIQSVVLSFVCPKSTYSFLPEDYNRRVEWTVTSDSRTMVCHHPSVTFHTDTQSRSLNLILCIINEKTQEQVAKANLKRQAITLSMDPRQNNSQSVRHYPAVLGPQTVSQTVSRTASESGGRGSAAPCFVCQLRKCNLVCLLHAVQESNSSVFSH